MLKEIRISNFAIIDHLRATFTSGFNVLTGETGAGKSILVDALGLVIGEKASVEMIKTGADETVVEALFEIPSDSPTIIRLNEKGININDGIIIRRIINRTEKGRIYINDNLVSLRTLSEITPELVDIHGQHEHQSLLSSDKQIDLLDSYGALLAARKEISSLFSKLNQMQRELALLEGNERERAQREDMLKFQITEIDGANLKVDEEKTLEYERLILSNAAKLSSVILDSYSKLYSSDCSIISNIDAIIHNLKELIAIDNTLKDTLRDIETSSTMLHDSAYFLRDYMERIEFNPEKLEQIEERLDQISRLKRKYGDTIADILSYREKAKNELLSIERGTEKISALRNEIREAEDAYRALTDDLSRKRAVAAKEIEGKIEEELNALSMKAKFTIKITQDGSWGYKGIDRVEFLISTNPGEEPKSLSKIASGGELSRIMLALRSILAEADRIPTIIFDEIDAGIGGDTANIVGKRLKFLSSRAQVLCITHLPQIASLADTHIAVRKGIEGKRAIVRIKNLAGEERKREIERMLGGKDFADLLGKTE